MLNPQQQAFKEAYMNPKSETFGSATQSAIKAGYGKQYAEQILSDGGTWISEVIGDLKRAQRADQVLDETMNYKEKDPATRGLKLKAAVFVAGGMNREKYANRNEVTGKDGKELVGVILYPKPNDQAEDSLGTDGKTDGSTDS